MPSLATTISHDFTPWPQDWQDNYRAQGYWTGAPLGDLLRQSARAAAKRTAIIAGDKRWTYQELDERADQLANGLLTQGIQAGSHVVLQMAVSFLKCFSHSSVWAQYPSWHCQATAIQNLAIFASMPMPLLTSPALPTLVLITVSLGNA
jgi:acyl-CoA synthetase (AMP-forming)/AMP-acid ligase II